MSRFGPSVARSFVVQHQRQMASASAPTDPIQKLFVEKIREFKKSNKGLDETHEKTLNDEMLRLKRVYKVDDVNKLTQLDYKFSSEHDVSLRDIDETREIRAKIHLGEYQKQLKVQAKSESALLATIPEQVQHDLHLPPLNKPDVTYLNANDAPPAPAKLSEPVPDYQFVGEKMTPDKLERELLVKFGEKMPTIHDDKAPERDVINFPRQPVPLDTPPTRHHVIPESWLQFFYPKTGVTGPYTFAATFGTFLLSKEWVPIEHEFITVISTVVICTAAVIKLGPKLRAWHLDKVNKEIEGWDRWQQGNIATLEDMKNHYTNELKKVDLLNTLYSARKQDVELQLECEYRNRLKTIYDDTKRRLNYLVAKADAQRQISHSNMVNWVISNVLSSVGQKQDNEVLDSCIDNLKQLADKNTNAV